MSLYRVCRVDDVWDGEMVHFIVKERSLLVIHLNQDFFVYDDKCPHQGAPLHEGHLDSGTLTCPVHCWQFDVKSGRGLNPATANLLRYEVEIRNGEVFANIPDQQSENGCES